jgi:hypothetical protein
MNEGAARRRSRTARTRHREHVCIDRHFHDFRFDPGECDDYQNLETGLDDVGRRFSAQFADRRDGQLEKLAVQPLGAIDQLTSPGPHESSWIGRGHETSPRGPTQNHPSTLALWRTANRQFQLFCSSELMIRCMASP